jgi:hypothetical protein
MIPQMYARARGPVAVMAHEAGYGLSKSHNRVRIY